MERINGVLSRRDLIKKEYNKIMENRLPNIMNFMNSQMSQVDMSINENTELQNYDDTDLLSKMFSKENNRSLIINEVPSAGKKPHQLFK